MDELGPSAAGRRAAAAALAQLGAGLRLDHDGTRPIVQGAEGLAISTSHGRTLAVAVAGPLAHLGIDLCERDRGAQIRALAGRFFDDGELALLVDDRAAAAVWSAKEAGLKALGLGLLASGLFDEPARCPVRVAALDPPRFDTPALQLALADREDCVVALAYTAPSITMVAPFM